MLTPKFSLFLSSAGARPLCSCSFFEILLSDAAYSAEMIKSLKQISAADSVVGAYFSSPTGAFYKSALVDIQALYQSVGGRKGVVIVYGESFWDFDL